MDKEKAGEESLVDTSPSTLPIIWIPFLLFLFLLLLILPEEHRTKTTQYQETGTPRQYRTRFLHITTTTFPTMAPQSANVPNATALLKKLHTNPLSAYLRANIDSSARPTSPSHVSHTHSPGEAYESFAGDAANSNRESAARSQDKPGRLFKDLPGPWCCNCGHEQENGKFFGHMEYARERGRYDVDAHYTCKNESCRDDIGECHHFCERCYSRSMEKGWEPKRNQAQACIACMADHDEPVGWR